MADLVDGRCSLSNNLTENTIRPITCGKKNWMFSDIPDGAHVSMAVYTHIANATAHNRKTYDYLNFVLESRPSEGMTNKELEAFAPWSEAAQAACGKTQE